MSARSLIGSKWKHTNGNEYIIIEIANQDSTNVKYPLTIVYKGDNGKVWAKTLEDWHRSMTLITNR